MIIVKGLSMKRTNKFVFDVDGTLTESRCFRDDSFGEFFLDFCRKNDVYIVTGSDRAKTLEQLGPEIYYECKLAYQCSGNDVWSGSSHIRSNSWVLPKHVRTWLYEKLEQSDFSIQTGLHIEERPGCVNFSIVGRNATKEQRATYIEYEGFVGERRLIADLFNLTFAGLEATIGGDTGLDIGPIGANKSQIMADFGETDNVIFFGDKMFEGGNDFPLSEANKDGINFHVRNVQHTWDILKEFYLKDT